MPQSFDYFDSGRRQCTALLAYVIKKMQWLKSKRYVKLHASLKAWGITEIFAKRGKNSQ